MAGMTFFNIIRFVNIECLLLLKEWPRLICFLFWPTSFPRSGLTDADAAASAILRSQQLSAAVVDRWSMSPFWPSANPSWRGAQTAGDQLWPVRWKFHCAFHWNLKWNLPLEQHFLKICWIWATSYQLPSIGHQMRWHHLKARKAARGSANEWLAGWNCRWTNFATWQAGENRRTPELKSVQRTPAILKEGHLWIHRFHQVSTSLISVILQVWFSKIGTSHTHVKMCRLPHPGHPTFFSWSVNISFENRWQNRCGTWISHGFPMDFPMDGSETRREGRQRHGARGLWSWCARRLDIFASKCMYKLY